MIVIKRSLSPGFAGIDNDLFYKDNTSMLFSDAKGAASDIAAQVEELYAQSFGRRKRGSARPITKPRTAASSRAKISGMLVVEKKNFTSTFWVFWRTKIAARTNATIVM